MSKQVSEERQAAYYIGLVLMILGVLMFASTFFTFMMHFGDFQNFDANAKSDGFRAFGGMALLILGGIVRGIGSRGLAGSGVVLDPEKAREDLEPYTRMAGGMAKDALDEAGISLGKTEPERVIMVKCQACGKLNQEDAKFCQECGKKM
jgi:zinc-ribbon domain